MSALSPSSTTAGTSRRTRRWGWLGLALLLLAALLVTGAVSMVHALDLSPIHVTIDGDTLHGDLALSQLPPAHQVVMVCLLALALLAALVIVPVAIVVAVLAIALVVLLLVGLPMVAVAMVLSIALSPLILLVWLLWRALRPSTTIAA